MSLVLFDRLRLFFNKGRIYNSENLLQNISDPSRLFASGSIDDFTNPNFISEQTGTQINRLERYKDYDQMDEVGEISLALDMYADESSLRDPELNHSLYVKTGNLRLKEEIDDFLYNVLNIDGMIRPLVRYLCKYGDFPAEIIPTKNRDGVASLKFMEVYNFTRVETKFGDLVGFFYQNDNASSPSYLHPWQVMHVRLTSFEKLYNPYGRSMLDGARKDFRRLRLMEDAAIVYRLSRASEKRVFKVPVGNLPPKEREQYIQLIARRFKKHKFIDPATNQMNERYAPHIQDDDFWVPVTADGSGIEISTLDGAANLDQIADIEYFKKKMVSALKIPFSRVGLADGDSEGGKSIAQGSPEFAKAVQWVQDQVIMGIKKVILVHLALRGYTVDYLKDFELGMTSASAIDELYRIETWASRVDIMGGLKELGFFPYEWIVKRFTNLTEDELKLIERKMALDSKNADSEEDEDFLEHKDKDISKLIMEFKKLENKDITSKIISNNINDKYPNYKFLLNSNEFDGLNSQAHGGIESIVEGRDVAIRDVKLLLESISSSNTI
jgi:hypothetical protein